MKKLFIPGKPLSILAIFLTALYMTVGAGLVAANPFNGAKPAKDRNEASPTLDIKANGQDGPLTIFSSTNLLLTVNLNAGGNTGNADWWAIVQDSNGNWYYYDLTTQSFQSGSKPTYTGALFDLSPFQILNAPGLPAGVYTCYFGVDMVPDGAITMANAFYDSLVINVNSGSLAPRKLPDTGQTTCYDNSATITCASPGQPFYGQDANFTTNSPSYADNGDGTVTDNITGLMWQRQDDDNTYNWYEATGTADATDNPGGATNYCASLTLGGYSDWRAPTAKELNAITNSGTYNPAIDGTYFPGANASNYWSATNYTNATGRAWRVSFYDGTVRRDNKPDKFYVRCVRGAQKTASLTDNGNGTITDNITGLMWQQQDDATKKTWQSTLAYCAGLSLGGHSDWRLPNKLELGSIIERKNYNPAINSTYFPGTASDYYWSSTSYSAHPSFVWVVNFHSGYINNYFKLNTFYSRCVRG